MRTASIRILAIACLASLGLGTSANAAFIFAFGQSDPTNTGVITATPNGANTQTTLTTNSTPNPGSIPILVSQEGNLSVAQTALETFVGVTSTGPATIGPNGPTQLYSGTINFTQVGGPLAGQLILSIMFTNSVLEGAGNSGALRGSQPGQGTVTLTAGPAGGAIAAAVGVPVGTAFTGAYSNSLVGITPPLGIVGSTIAGFTAQTAGNVSPSAIPEPASIVMTSTAVLAGLGVFGWRRLKVSKA